MAQVSSIDSNVVGLRYAREDSIGVVSGNETWYPIEPNSFADFGGEIGLTPRTPLSPSRQARKGVPTSLNASGGFNVDLTQTNLQDLLQGFLYADFRRKGEEAVTAVDIDGANPDEYEVAATAGFLVGSLIKGSGFTNSANNALNQVTAITSNVSVEVATGLLVTETPPAGAKIVVVGHVGAADDLDVTITGDFATITSSVLDFTTLGLIPGEWIYVGGDSALLGFSNATNNGWKRIRSVAANALVVDKSAAGAMITEVSSGSRTVQLFFGRVLKNEADQTLQVRRTFQLERSLGAPDDAAATQLQAEYIIGAHGNEAVFNFQPENKVDVDLSFIGTDVEQLVAAAAPNLKSAVADAGAGDAPALVDESAFNTASDIVRIGLSVVSSSSEAPSQLVSFVESLVLTVNNNVQPNPALGVFGAAVVSLGTFEVSAEMTAFFMDVDAAEAVRNSSDVSLDLILSKENTGIAFDLPLVALGDARATVELNEPVKLPLSSSAASGAKVLSTLNHTLMLCFYDYLPTAAAA